MNWKLWEKSPWKKKSSTWATWTSNREHTSRLSLFLQAVAAFAVSAVASQWERTGKPFNPLLGETYELNRYTSIHLHLCLFITMYSPFMPLLVYTERSTASGWLQSRYPIIPRWVPSMLRAWLETLYSMAQYTPNWNSGGRALRRSPKGLSLWSYLSKSNKHVGGAFAIVTQMLFLTTFCPTCVSCIFSSCHPLSLLSKAQWGLHMEQPSLLRAQHHLGQIMDRAVWLRRNSQPQVNSPDIFMHFVVLALNRQDVAVLLQCPPWRDAVLFSPLAHDTILNRK